MRKVAGEAHLVDNRGSEYPDARHIRIHFCALLRPETGSQTLFSPLFAFDQIIFGWSYRRSELRREIFADAPYVAAFGNLHRTFQRLQYRSSSHISSSLRIYCCGE